MDEVAYVRAKSKQQVKFSMDPTHKAAQYACSDLLKCGQWQMRQKLKDYFDGVPANKVRTTPPMKSIQ
ncbi:hypothetical protein PVAP13_7NG135885 [Panicum virgatum]|uniref:Uncharacterized protein n=1 Tax=Panicum virgatum TaxID=38727 RepID=A0A8T0PWQ0_PANVG|nr:hypothetical protein PVAP13_7NG135885 [Panicum virgatum]